MLTLRRRLTSKTPTHARKMGLLCGLAAVLLPRLGAAAPVEGAPSPARLTEAEVIRTALVRAPAGRVADATDQLAAARTRTAAPFHNPEASWSRETVQSGPVGGQGSQDIVSASLTIDVVRPLAARATVASEGAWLRAEASLARTHAVLNAVLTFYEVVLAERRVEVLSQSVANLEEAARVLVRREAAGTASGYESTRLSIARELSRSHLAQAQGNLRSTKAQLAARLGLRSESVQVATDLTFVVLPPESALAEAGAEARPAVRYARAAQRLADEAQDRAAWAWLPTLELEAGMKRSNNAGAADGYGYVFGASLSLPVFDYGQAQRAQAQAQSALAAARTEALSRTTQAELQSELTRFRTAREELQRFESQTSGQVEALLAAANSGYREGARTILELLDAQRTQTEVAERRLSLLGDAKRAEARLRAAAGDLQ